MEIVYKKKAVKYIASCNSSTKKRLKESIEYLPLGDVKKLRGFDSEYRLRVGELRVLFSVQNGIITINDIKPRGQVYKGL